MSTSEPATQRERALELANQIRSANATTCRELRGLPFREGADLLADLLESGQVGAAGSMPVGRLVKCVRLIGDEGARRLMREADISSQDRKVRQLTVRQRQALAFALRQHKMSSNSWWQAA